MSAVTAAPAVAPAPRAGRGHPATHLWRLALADFRERTRRPAYFVSLAVMAWLAHGMLPPAGAGYRTFAMGDTWRPAYGPEWVGTLTGIMTSLYFMMVGFYLVKGAVERDRRTGVGQILAAASVSRRRYLAGKALSNFAVLASMLVVALGVALVTQQLLGEVRRFDPLAAALPLFLFAAPVAAVVAAGAVLLECIPGLAGGFGNVVWFVFTMVALSTGVLQSEDPAARGRDLMGVAAVAQSTFDALHAAHPEVRVDRKAISMGVNVSPEWRGVPIRTFAWKGLRWDAAAVAARGAWLLFAAALVALAAVVFDRFERPARAPARHAWRPRAWFGTRPGARGAAASIGSAATLSPAVRGRGFATLVRAELALLLHGQPLLWYLGAAGMVIATVFAPLGAVRAGLLPVLSVWPVLLLGALGSRERLNGTEALLFSVARPVTRVLAAGWAAGALLYLALGAPALLRFASAGQWEWAAGWALGSALVPALALALGVWTGGSKFFEVLVLFAWYMGPMHHIAEVDYTGVTAPRSPALWVAYGALTAALLVAGFLGRARRVRN
jgi:hypothetical protein